MREIQLSRGSVTLVDDGDYERVNAAGPWHARPHETSTYAQRRVPNPHGGFTTEQLHRFLTGWPLVDHRNGDGLDNRRANLRQATGTQNNGNSRRRKDNTSGFKGVTWSRERGRWHARIQVHRKSHHLGRFATPEAAARAYDAAALELFGEFARLNFPRGTA